MKFYEKIIGLNKNAPSDELIITFSNNGFEFNRNIYLDEGKVLSLNGDNAIYFRNSQITISDLSGYRLRFSGNSKTILFNFQTGNIDISTWNLGTIYSTNGYFNQLIPSGENKVIGASNNRWEKIFTNQITCTGIATQSLYVRSLNIDPINSTTNPLVLPINSKISSNWGQVNVAGVEIRSSVNTTIYGGIQRSTSGSTWNYTGKQVKWKCLETRTNNQACLQFFTKIDLTTITENYNSLLIPSPITSNLIVDNDYLQLSYGATTSQYAPTIEPFEDQGNQYFLVERAYNLTHLYIQVTRFK